jgi:adenylate cyclase, class 2
MHWEVEQKFRIEDNQVEQELASLGVQFSAAVRQRDQYFNHPARHFAVTDEAFRIRSVGERNYVTYKGPKIDPMTKTRRELELPIGDGSEAASLFAEMLRALGFQPAGVVTKQRRTGPLMWEGQRLEVVLDDVEGLGPFLELETSADDDRLAMAQAAVKSLAARLGLSGSERRSYLELLLGRSA